MSRAWDTCRFSKIDNVCIDLASDPSANNGKGTVAICMIASEITSIRNVYLRADTALANLIANDFNVPSSAVVSTDIMSNSCITLDGLCTLFAKHPVGCCWRGVNAVNVTMNNLYLQSATIKGPQGNVAAPGLVIEGGYKISASAS